MAVDGVYIIVYTVIERTVINMTVAKVFENGRSQAVRLPKEYRFSSDEVVINRIGSDALFIAEPASWFGAMLCVLLPYFYYRKKLLGNQE
jgi:antitoxin VapB